jgi:hypothetical protein
MKYIPLGGGQNAMVDDEDYEWLSRYRWYAYYDRRQKCTYAAADTPGGRRVLMHNLIMGLDTMEDEVPVRSRRTKPIRRGRGKR